VERARWTRVAVSGFLAGILCLSLLARVEVGAAPVSALEPGDQAVPAKVEPLLWDQLRAGGQADMVVRMGEQADLTAAYQIQDWEARGEYVYEALRAVAEKSQAQAKALLDGANLSYQTMIAGNELYVWGGTLAAAEALAALPEVDTLRATRTYRVDPIIDQEAPAGAESLAWGISYTHADQFWAAFGLQGDAIKVANIDTGVQYDHPALDQAFACPGDPGNPACWADPTNICGGTACDNNGHGTHTMGTMVADDDPALTYQAGMAPNATWIACKGCESTSCSDFALNACADWILAPGGDPANRPHVVNNSWSGAAGCDTSFQAKVQAWRASGIFPAFSAGNSGSACDTLRSPGDFQESFASAAVDSAGVIATFSSRGPSCFGDDPYTKPNIAAPGVSICSAIPPNSWTCGYSGTSMASPHSAGAVALLWSCNPALIGQVDQTFEILQNSAGAAPPGNCGAPPDGEGNYTFGYGYLDVYAAGVAGCSSGGVDILLVNADSDNMYGSDIQDSLQAFGDLGIVGLFNAISATPSLARLQAYDVVLTWSNSHYYNPIAMGNVLADYVDAGGKVINLMFSMGTHGWEMQGRFMDQAYTAMNGTTLLYQNVCLGTYDAGHPIMAGVTDVCELYRMDGTYLTAGSSEVAQWDDGLLFVAAKDDQSVVSINAYVGYNHQWTGQMADVVHNAILWLAQPEPPFIYLPVLSLNDPWDPYCEPNNSKGTAYGPLLPGISFQAYPDDANDYYYFTLSSAKTVDFLVSNYAPTSEFGDLLIYNNVDPGPIAQFGLSGYTQMWINDLSLGAGKYYVQVYTVDGHFSNAQLYALRVTY
jgi:hypothetical protein